MTLWPQRLWQKTWFYMMSALCCVRFDDSLCLVCRAQTECVDVSDHMQRCSHHTPPHRTGCHPLSTQTGTSKQFLFLSA